MFCLSLFLFSVTFLSDFSISIFSKLQSLQPNLVLNFNFVLFNISHLIL